MLSMYVVDTLEYWLTSTRVLQMMAYGLVCAFCVVWVILTISKMNSRGWNGFFFVVLCALTTFYSLCRMLWYAFPRSADVAMQLLFFATMLLMVIPGGLYLHVGSQLSPRPARLLTLLVIFGVPLTAGLLVRVYGLEEGYDTLLGHLGVRLAILVWCGGLLLGATFRCMKVFYQVPRHMRKSTYYLLAGIVFMALFAVMNALNQDYWSSFGGVACILASLACTYFAFKKTYSSNVIVTSREFIMNNLSTYILTLSRGMRILDWNKKGPKGFAPLPEPVCMEGFDEYLNRFVCESRGNVIGRGNQNVVTAMQDGTEKHYLIVVHPVAEAGRTFGHVAEISEVTQLYSALRQLDDIAMLDQLTGLSSRNAYMEQVRASTGADSMPLVVIVGDMNGLKIVNDTHGHMAGDSLLKAVANVIRLYLPKNAFAARIGGDEFTILLPGGTIEQATRFIEQVNRDCAAMDNELFGAPGISWGCAVMRSPEENYDDVFREADRIMYEQKRKHFVFRSRGLINSGIPPAESSDGALAFGGDEAAPVPPHTQSTQAAQSAPPAQEAQADQSTQAAQSAPPAQEAQAVSAPPQPGGQANSGQANANNTK